ncbi:Organic hydroperoxide resistance transcriptional regulator [Kingella potus]|uniref:Organic hydroperoxide resistance transcriptional regulator n=1 Tax=Kingella potus TaxID=265175 RepID=A0A377R2B2_9NEIS|nr:homoprotocatechuate degradation operon regulator HpaR [Kingella potus]UOP00707.1 homoprotocatechuate degradation operon regulator HpaR [Kingella potus]STR02897.1 Organic hydroperoxide resistance transcriptional regulator [Kingella potus]
MGSDKHNSINITMLQARDVLLSYLRPIFNGAGITDQQWRIIRLLAENGTMDFQDLSVQACILRPSLTGILNRLEQNGLLIRMKPSNDQRRVFLKLTPRGGRVFEDIRTQVDKCYEDLEQRMTREKMHSLHNLLAEMASLKTQDSVRQP